MQFLTPQRVNESFRQRSNLKMTKAVVVTHVQDCHNKVSDFFFFQLLYLFPSCFYMWFVVVVVVVVYLVRV